MIDKKSDLVPFNTWGVGGPADYFCLPKTDDEIVEALEFARDQKLPLTILGGGSNVLISDQGIEGMVICTQKFVGIEETVSEKQVSFVAKAGTPKFELMRRFVKHKLAPALFLSGLPGDVGGGVVMNAGVAEARTPREFVEIVDAFDVIEWPSLKKKTFNKDQVQWSYRHTQGWQPGIITRVKVSWPNIPEMDIPAQVKAANQLRMSKQPLDQKSCGSTFKNPEGFKAGQLIDERGLKGYQIGGAQISTKHANFFVNINNAKAADIAALIEHAQKVVKEKKGISLTTEVVRLGRWK